MNKTSNIPPLDKNIIILNKSVIRKAARPLTTWNYSQENNQHVGPNMMSNNNQQSNRYSNANGAQGPDSTSAGKKNKRFKAIFILFVVVFLAGIFYYLYSKLFLSSYEETTNAYVNGNIVSISSEISGTVDKVYVDDTTFVHQGDKLIHLSNQSAKLGLDKAQSALASSVRSLDGQYATINQYSALLAQQRLTLKQAQADYARRLPLAKNHIISQEELEHARNAIATARAALAVTEQQRKVAMVNTTGVTLDKNPAILQAKSAFIEAWINYNRTTIVAPVSGYISRNNIHVGSQASPNAPLLSIVPLDNLWVDANFKETQLKNLRIGQKVTLVSDIYGSDLKYHGRIVGFAPGTGTAFSLLPAQNATGNWIKIVQRVPVKIALDPAELAMNPLRVGMSMTVKVDITDLNGRALQVAPKDTPIYKTDVYEQKISDAEKIADKIIKQNTINESGNKSPKKHHPSRHRPPKHSRNHHLGRHPKAVKPQPQRHVTYKASFLTKYTQ